MMEDLTISLVQTPLYWENAQANLGMLEEKIRQLKEQTDLILLPELFTTGFSMNVSALAEPENLTTYRWLRQMTAQTGAVITGSCIIKEKGKYYNRLVWMRPDGTFAIYDKRHLFRMAEENKHYSSGNKLLIESLKGWSICPLICYDLRFPVWSRNVGNQYDLLLYVANWPASRKAAWKKLLPARAIENNSYVVGVNRIGSDKKGINYSGDSGIWDFKGEKLLDMMEQEAITSFTLKKEPLCQFREAFPVYLDADGFQIAGKDK